MKTPNLTLMIGPSGAGKSTWLRSDVAKNKFGIHESHIISSDQIRQDLTGDFRDQSHNKRVFEIVRELVKVRLINGLSTAIDATHLKKADRIESAELRHVNPNVALRYIILNRSMEEKIRDAGWRAEVDGLLERHENTFNSNLQDILSGDNFGKGNVFVYDQRTYSPDMQV